MADPAGPAARTGILGPVLVVVTAVLVAGLLVLPLMMLVLGVLAALSTWFPALGDPTWNDGDAGLGLGFGGVATLAVLATGAGGFTVLARRFRLPVRPWLVGALAGSLLLAGAVLGVAF
ncbi:hypothetical protein [Nakamurella sp.]|uniref:hypothetical protein n=1 Tax=Nakamurella sp. TaxID=1869182 RepID=UPI003B3B765A